jgi:hypothetical protein
MGHKRNTKKKFWSLIEVKGPDECWPWKGKLNRDGYAQWYWKGQLRMVHHVAFQIHNHCFFPRGTRKTGSGGIVIRHNCDNPPCCNPHHLLKGTQLDNVRDKFERGRNCKWWKVSEEMVKQIKKKFSSGKWTKKEIGDEYGIHPSWVGRILTKHAGLAAACYEVVTGPA